MNTQRQLQKTEKEAKEHKRKVAKAAKRSAKSIEKRLSILSVNVLIPTQKQKQY